MPFAAHVANAAPNQLAGVIVPYDMALDSELWRWVPEAVGLLFTRTPYTDLPVTLEMAEAVGDLATIQQCARDLSSVGPEVLAYGCTSGSFVNGVEGERRMVEAIRDAGGAEAVTTSGALLAALAHLGIRRVAAATPYDAAVTERLGVFLQEAGVEVVSEAHLGLHSEIWKVPYEQTLQLIRDADHEDAEAIVVSCTNLATYDVIAPLEDELGKPVVTANQATMWSALRALGRHAVGEGQRLLATSG
ncbi:MAG TPA: Asp/Glu/hydantoin racemase [Marmoricola sp.]|nr:Asp/Glu/hydantoin racemase [Marmoricola sp.]